MNHPVADGDGLTVDAFSVPKAGNAESENEDAWAARTLYPGGYRLSVADGATESSFSQLWSCLLVETFVESTSLEPEELLKSFDAPRTVWAGHVGARELPWYAQEKAKMGAFAAFLGLTLDLGMKRWHSMAIGDCNLFQLDEERGGLRLIEAFPLERSAQFGMNPYLVGTVPGRDGEISVQVRTGTVRSGDVLLLTSDALAAWLLKKQEAGTPVWDRVVAVADHDGFAAMIEEARADGLHNDDSTLVRLVFRGDDDGLA